MLNFRGESLEPYWSDNKFGCRYNINITLDCDLHVCLGEIKPRKDGRFDCWRKEQKNYFYHWCPGAQTVKPTLEDARRWVEDGINITTPTKV